MVKGTEQTEVNTYLNTLLTTCSDVIAALRSSAHLYSLQELGPGDINFVDLQKQLRELKEVVDAFGVDVFVNSAQLWTFDMANSKFLANHKMGSVDIGNVSDSLQIIKGFSFILYHEELGIIEVFVVDSDSFQANYNDMSEEDKMKFAEWFAKRQRSTNLSTKSIPLTEVVVLATVQGTYILDYVVADVETFYFPPELYSIG